MTDDAEEIPQWRGPGRCVWLACPGRLEPVGGGILRCTACGHEHVVADPDPDDEGRP